MTNHSAEQPTTISDIEEIDSPNRHRSSRKHGLTAVVAGFALAGALAGCGGGVDAAPQPTSSKPVATAGAEATPTTPSAAKTEKAPVGPDGATVEGRAAIIDTIKISGTSFEAVAKSYVEQNSRWLNTGLTIGKDLGTINYGPEQMVTIIEGRYDAAITDQLYTNSPNARAIVADYEGLLRKGTIESYSISIARYIGGMKSADGQESAPYELKITPTEVKVTATNNPNFAQATEFTADVKTVATDNGNLNIAQNNLEHGQPAQLNITRNDFMSFKRDSVNAPWKLNDKTNISIVNNSK